MKLYLDASAILPLFIKEARTRDAMSAIQGHILVLSDFAAAEFSSAVARRARMREISETQAKAVWTDVDRWRARITTSESLLSRDLIQAQAFVRQLDLALRTPDALHLAICQRCQATLLTYDQAMAGAARRLGVDVTGNEPSNA